MNPLGLCNARLYQEDPHFLDTVSYFLSAFEDKPGGLMDGQLVKFSNTDLFCQWGSRALVQVFEDSRTAENRHITSSSGMPP